MGSSQTRDRTRVPYIGRRILNHCTTREVPGHEFLPCDFWPHFPLFFSMIFFLAQSMSQVFHFLLLLISLLLLLTQYLHALILLLGTMIPYLSLWLIPLILHGPTQTLFFMKPSHGIGTSVIPIPQTFPLNSPLQTILYFLIFACIHLAFSTGGGGKCI